MTILDQLTKKLEHATQSADNQQTGQAIKGFEEIIKFEVSAEDTTEDVVKQKETATYRLAKIFKEKGLIDELIELQKVILPLFIEFPKSKTAKITRTLFDMTMTADVNVSGTAVQHYAKLVDLSRHIITWCEKESRSFLRMRIECNLADLLFKQQKYADSLEILSKLTYELKKKEDKQLLVESQLVESKVYHALENINKAKASLTAVKTTANSIYVVPYLQAEIDFMSGLIAADEKDYILAYSYFYETFEGYRAMNDIPRAGAAFKFMLFSKVMNKQSEDALNLINSALSLKYQSRSLEAMKEVALANKQQSLHAFQKCAASYEKELFDDFVIRRHFNFLYNSLLEENLKKIIEPYDQVQIDYVAIQIDLPVDKVLMKLSEMILDEKIRGTLDQGRNCLIIFEQDEPTEMFDHSLQTIKNLDTVVDSLYEKAQHYKQKYLK